MCCVCCVCFAHVKQRKGTQALCITRYCSRLLLGEGKIPDIKHVSSVLMSDFAGGGGSEKAG